MSKASNPSHPPVFLASGDFPFVQGFIKSCTDAERLSKEEPEGVFFVNMLVFSGQVVGFSVAAVPSLYTVMILQNGQALMEPPNWQEHKSRCIANPPSTVQ